jgi:hypothetical protein
VGAFTKGFKLGILNDKAREFKREQLRELLKQCTEEEVAIFNRIYKSVEEIPESKMDDVYQQCLNSIGTREY